MSSIFNLANYSFKVLSPALAITNGKNVHIFWHPSCSRKDRRGDGLWFSCLIHYCVILSLTVWLRVLRQTGSSLTFTLPLRVLKFLSKPVKHGGVDNNSTKSWFALNVEKICAEIYWFTACQGALIILIVSHRLLPASKARITVSIAHTYGQWFEQTPNSKY